MEIVKHSSTKATQEEGGNQGQDRETGRWKGQGKSGMQNFHAKIIFRTFQREEDKNKTRVQLAPSRPCRISSVPNDVDLTQNDKPHLRTTTTLQYARTPQNRPEGRSRYGKRWRQRAEKPRKKQIRLFTEIENFGCGAAGGEKKEDKQHTRTLSQGARRESPHHCVLSPVLTLLPSLLCCSWNLDCRAFLNEISLLRSRHERYARRSSLVVSVHDLQAVGV